MLASLAAALTSSAFSYRLNAVADGFGAVCNAPLDLWPCSCLPGGRFDDVARWAARSERPATARRRSELSLVVRRRRVPMLIFMPLLHANGS